MVWQFWIVCVGVIAVIDYVLTAEGVLITAI